MLCTPHSFILYTLDFGLGTSVSCEAEIILYSTHDNCSQNHKLKYTSKIPLYKTQNRVL